VPSTVRAQMYRMNADTRKLPQPAHIAPLASGKSLCNDRLRNVSAGIFAMFDGFTQSEIAIGDAVMHVTAGGSGPPLLLLHGYPQTRAAWHAVADSLAR